MSPMAPKSYDTQVFPEINHPHRNSNNKACGGGKQKKDSMFKI